MQLVSEINDPTVPIDAEQALAGGVYLDGFATTRLGSAALAAIIEASRWPTNAGSPHLLGERAARILAQSRQRVAEAIGATAIDVIFTSGATESNNIAILSAASAGHAAGRSKVIVSSGEHRSVLEPIRSLKAKGFEVCEIDLLPSGEADAAAFTGAIDEQTAFVSLMLANNVTGIVQPVGAIAEAARARGAAFHCDAAQALGKVPISVDELAADYVSFSGHKLHGPMGVGALYVGPTAPRPQALLLGGAQEGGVRPGTVPVPLIAGFAGAVSAAVATLATSGPRAEALANLLLAALTRRQVRFRRFGEGAAKRLPGSLALALAGVASDDMIVRLSSSVQLSSASACESGTEQVSHVLKSMGVEFAVARSFVRMLVDPELTEDDIERAADAIADQYKRALLATGGSHQ